jgi:hypothetical protein
MGLRGRLILAGAIALLVAAGLIGWGALQQSHYERQAEDQTAENARHADYDVRYRCVPLPALAERNCTIDTRREQREYARHEQDLYAQKTSAFWTFLMGSAALVGMILSSVGVFLVFFTFGETRRANVLNMRENARSTRRAVASAKETADALEAANKSAEAAAGQVKVAQDTAYRQLRAYISVEGVKISKVWDTGVSGHIHVHNAGQTPAAVTLHFATAILGIPCLDPRQHGPVPIQQWQHQPFLNAGSTDEVYFWYPIYPDERAKDAATAAARMKMSELIAGGGSLGFFVYGRVEFADFMRRSRVLHFSYRSSGKVILGQPFDLIPTPQANGYEDRGYLAGGEEA